MKKSDKLFSDEFVHFRWDDSLEGKMGFMEDGIGLLEHKVADGVGNTIHKADSIGFPFKSDNGSGWRFAYYDPHYGFKRAWMEGKKVQYMTTIYVKNKWEDVPDEWYWDGNDGTQYRIAPEKEWRPFKDVQEFKNAWYGKIPFPILNTGLEEPFIWVRWKGGKEHKLITGYYNEDSQVFLCGEWMPLERLFEHYEFLDGTPCGVEVEK